MQQLVLRKIKSSQWRAKKISRLCWLVLWSVLSWGAAAVIQLMISLPSNLSLHSVPYHLLLSYNIVSWFILVQCSECGEGETASSTNAMSSLFAATRYCSQNRFFPKMFSTACLEGGRDWFFSQYIYEFFYTPSQNILYRLPSGWSGCQKPSWFASCRKLPQLGYSLADSLTHSLNCFCQDKPN